MLDCTVSSVTVIAFVNWTGDILTKIYPKIIFEEPASKDNFSMTMSAKLILALMSMVELLTRRLPSHSTPNTTDSRRPSK